jgi:hypothetical protein
MNLPVCLVLYSTAAARQGQGLNRWLLAATALNQWILGKQTALNTNRSLPRLCARDAVASRPLDPIGGCPEPACMHVVSCICTPANTVARQMRSRALRGRIYRTRRQRQILAGVHGGSDSAPIGPH